MLTFHPTMDSHSLEVRRVIEMSANHLIKSQEEVLGHLMWHKDRSPRFVSIQGFGYLSLEEMKEMTHKVVEMLNRQLKEKGYAP